MKTPPFHTGIDILLVCGQGTYEEGRFFCEYPERDLYLHHALQVQPLCESFGYQAVICSGSYTRPQTPGLSEALSFRRIWDKFSRWPRATPQEPWFCAWEEAALDSAQNIYFGLCQARLEMRAQGFGEVPIQRIGVFTVWKFKRARYQALADALDIQAQFYFHGLADANESIDPDAAMQSEQRQTRLIRETKDPLLLADIWEQKRQQRNVSPEKRAVHMATMQKAFPASFAALDPARWREQPEEALEQFREAFWNEVIAP